ncbi:hypothetical protein F442_04871 [Phytophthora nicotianae P10297]|uniref:Uncharacterized protein n=1 Tax=Phytophthora nicotianae P10297 TaxID=1317064 RepID=W2ZQU7_PHYNI|nr:hypothetical protein F442_04871 [Phytophthora nicotianae P10297]
MALNTPDASGKFGNARFALDTDDLQSAREMGLLLDTVPVESEDSTSTSYGIAYNQQKNIADHEFSSQQSVRACVKSFAQSCGFQIFVRQPSVKPNNSENAKYQLPVFVNAFGHNGKWKTTKANFCHNHAKFVGFSRVTFVEGTVPRADTAMRNTTQELQQMMTWVMTELLPMHNRTTDTLTGAVISKFLLGKGFTLGRSAISRMKLDIEDHLRGDITESYQKLQAYFVLMEEKILDLCGDSMRKTTDILMNHN